MWSKKTFLRVRVQFVECRDAFMQILASLDRDKNSSVGVASFLMLRQEESEKWLMVEFCFVTMITNWACEGGETYGQTCFIFFIFDDQLDLPVKDRQTLLVCPRFPLVIKGSEPKKKKFFFFNLLVNNHLFAHSCMISSILI